MLSKTISQVFEVKINNRSPNILLLIVLKSRFEVKKIQILVELSTNLLSL